MEGQQADIAPGSPLAVVALFTEIVRQRFLPSNGLAWAWYENPTPREHDRNDIDAPAKVMIEPAFNVNTETRNVRPAIFIDKGETQPEKVSLGNFVGQKLSSGMSAHYLHGHMSIEIEAVSDQKGESAILADLVWFYMLAGRQHIQAMAGLHDLSEPVLGRTVPYEADKNAWSTRVSFAITVPFRWTTVPISPLLQEIVLRYRQSGDTNPDTYLLKQYIP